MTAHDIARSYLMDRHWKPVPIPFRAKGPTIRGWQNLSITVENLGQYFNGEPQNVGVQMGAVSNGLTDVDLDCAEAIALAPRFLPSTPAVFGRQGKPKSHYLYTMTDADGAPDKGWLKFGDHERKNIIELRLGRGKGAQSIFPGSTHVSGELIEWATDGTPAPAGFATLHDAVKKIAVAVVLWRAWPPQGGRHDAALALGGFLARTGWQEDAIQSFVHTVAYHAGSDDPAARAQDAADAAASHGSGENVYGLPGMIEFFGETPAKRVAKILGYNESPAVILPAAAAGLPWRERVKGGIPKATMHNARIAIQALNIECKYDTFHHKILFGYANEDMRHDLQSVIGDNLNHGIIRLRQIISDRFGFDPDDKSTSDAVVSLAMQHRFDPIADYLAEAQGEWDGTRRLDRLAPDYFNADDTPLNRAIGRKTLIAAVRRVRQPGCKFDNITTMESPEGYLKSTAWRVLAGDENFSDQSIIGANSREVQEHLAGVWIHENSELAGMSTRDVNAVKAYASRQEDIARPAYGRHTIKQPRRSIDVATTNDSEYLQSQTGNRRFWPLKVNSPIDLNQLRRDRDQLWAEAAHYEAQGESVELDPSLWAAAGEAQERRRVRDLWEEVLANIEPFITLPRRADAEEGDEAETIPIVHVDGDHEMVATIDLLTHVLRIPPAQQRRADSMRLSTVMQKLGWKRPDAALFIGRKRLRGYWRVRQV